MNTNPDVDEVIVLGSVVDGILKCI